MPRYIEQLVSEQVRKSELCRRRAAATQQCASPVITISRRMGTGARVVAEKLAGDLGWSLWGKDLITAIAEDAEVSRKVVEAFDEKTVSEIETLSYAALGDFEMGDFIYQKHLAKAVASISKLGNAIILGRGAWFLVLTAFHIRIDASDEHRIANMVRYEGLSRDHAEAKLRESDRERREFLERTYGRDRAHAFEFDLSIRMDRLGTDGAVEIIKTAIREWCKETPGQG